ncbi:hypothetical protein PGT21_030300 [Puccinia graminis f. sp. tritici]|uniref:Uncharacterized protein n=3 Tax=Puccinia graminis f. sp. tritici TaxID=56615 RepID=A0A5B0MQ86_PUCGR|nr:hypothetical protein PGT21_030300 [Puccinia graminis f. sp. tritici]
MIAYRCVLIVVISILLATTFPVDAKGCWNVNGDVNRKRNNKDCYAAMKKIIFDTSGKAPHLPTDEGVVKTISGGCSLIVKNPNHAIVTEPDIKVALEALFKKCPNIGGYVMFPNIPQASLEIRERAAAGSRYEAFNPDAELDKPYCYQAKGMPDIKANDDCIKAYEGLSTDSQGRISPTTNGAHVVFQSCYLSISTTDESMLQVMKKDADAIVKNMITKCDKKSGFVNLRGAQGKNGRVFVETHAA